VPKKEYQRVMVVSSSIDRGGLGNYLLTLAGILKSAGYPTCFLLTHGRGELYGSLENIIHDICVCSRKDTVAKYFCVLKEIWKKRPDVIINNYNATVQYLAPFLPLGTKVVHILHSDDRRFYRIAAINTWRVNAWVAPSPAVATNFNAYAKGKYEKRVKLIPHGTRIAEISRNNFSNKVELIFVGALYEYKGISLLPEICKILAKRGIVFHITVVGDGPERRKLEGSFSEIQSYVSFVGKIGANELEKYWSRSDLLVFPSRLEAFGLVLIEAMAHGVIPIVSPLKGIFDFIISPEYDGIIVDSFTDPLPYVDKIVKLVRNRPLMKDMKQNAIKTAVERFSIEEMKNNYNKLLYELCQKK